MNEGSFGGVESAHREVLLVQVHCEVPAWILEGAAKQEACGDFE